MDLDKDEKGRPNKPWAFEGDLTKEEWRDLFKDMYEYAENRENEVLSVQDVFNKFGIPRSTYYDKADKDEICNLITEAIKDLIVARVNGKSIKGEYAPSPAIWRMKQLGEVDSSSVNQHITGVNITEHRVVFKNFKKKEE